MSEETPSAESKPKGRYKEWEHGSAQEVVFARRLFFGMMALLALLLGSLVYGALR